jgi:fucose permease
MAGTRPAMTEGKSGLLAESLIVLGLVGDAFITILMILENQVLTIALSILLAGFVRLLYVLALTARRDRHKSAIRNRAITSG